MIRTPASVIAALAVLALSCEALGQTAYDGYLPDGPHPQAGQQPAFDLYPTSPVTVGGALGLGAGAMSWADVDASFFAPNRARPLETTVPAAVDLAGWVELDRTFRIGLQMMSLFGGDGRTSSNATSGGLLLEAGGGYNWYAWGGVALGLQGLRASSKDDLGHRYEYTGSGLLVRVHGHVEHALSDYVRIRLTPWIGFGQLMDETFSLPAVPGSEAQLVLPVDSGFRFLGGGLFVSLALASGR